MKNLKLKIIPIGLILIIAFGATVRFYNLNWGAPYYFHPDERNIAGSISRMYWEKTLNPHFFAYGSFWSYIVLLLVKLTDFQWMGNTGLSTDPFTRAIQILRVLSAIQGVGLIILSYFIGKSFSSKPKFLILILPLFIATSPGLIQASHFGTFEESLAFLYALIFYLTLRFREIKKMVIWFLICLVFGISVSVRVTSLILLPIIFLTLLFSRKKFILSLVAFVSLIVITAVIFYFSNPYSFDFSKFTILDFGFRGIFSSDFLNAMRYESDVALGALPVFYTQQFNQTTLIVYQFFKVLPFVLNPIIWFLFPISLIFILYQISVPFFQKQFNQSTNQYLLLFLFFLLTFLPNSLIFVKWTRYIIPSLPFVYVFVFLFLFEIRKGTTTRIFLPLLSLISLIFSLFFTSVYSTDTRIAAANWTKDNLKADVKILSEVYDMGIVPFNDVFHYSQIRLYNFYELDDAFNETQKMAELNDLIAHSDVIILPSRRIADTRIRLSHRYPNGNWFYKNLFEGKLGFKLVKTFYHPYDKILPVIIPDESFTVFDHPDIYIFKKI